MPLPRIVGNGKAATILILVFIVILCGLLWRKAHAEEHTYLRVGSAFGPGGAGPVIGLDFRFPQGNDFDLYAGTLLWGNTPKSDTNWDWHAGIRTCRWRVCANLGAAYVQRTDANNGTHTNFNLGLSYQFNWWRLTSIDYAHLSNAGTSTVNLGRNAALLDVRLQ